MTSRFQKVKLPYPPRVLLAWVWKKWKLLFSALDANNAGGDEESALLREAVGGLEARER